MGFLLLSHFKILILCPSHCFTLSKFSIDLTMSVTMYPTTLFKKCVSCCGFQEWYPLHTFVESFQGQYKDGSNGTCDFRDLIFDRDIKHFTHTILISTLKLLVPHMVLILYVCYLLAKKTSII